MSRAPSSGADGRQLRRLAPQDLARRPERWVEKDETTGQRLVLTGPLAHWDAFLPPAGAPIAPGVTHLHCSMASSAIRPRPFSRPNGVVVNGYEALAHLRGSGLALTRTWW